MPWYDGIEWGGWRHSPGWHFSRHEREHPCAEIGHGGAFWSDRYHPTLIQNGAHLGRCLFYIDMNMVSLPGWSAKND
jgi:hypothetical protein